MKLDDLKEGIYGLIDHPETQRALQFLHDWSPDGWVLPYFAILVVAGFLVGRYRNSLDARVSAYQNRSEALLSSFVMSNFIPPDYHLMNHITLELPDGSTQVDHILVSRFGIFVIETKDYKGWIFANSRQRNWTQILYKARYKFQNPLQQNARHVRAVKNLLDFLPEEAFKSVIVFTGSVEFKTEVPPGVFSLDEFINYLKTQTEEIMPLNRMQLCVGKLETARLAISRQTDIEHIQSVQLKHGNW